MLTKSNQTENNLAVKLNLGRDQSRILSLLGVKKEQKKYGGKTRISEISSETLNNQ